MESREVSTAPHETTTWAPLPRIARASVEAAFAGVGLPPEPEVDSPLALPRPVFVTLHDRAGHLRGCIGTLQARLPNAIRETWQMAREAAFSDPRFRPVRPAELPDLRFEVSVLHPLEAVASPAELDCRRYGIVLTTADGRRAALLPAIDGVETVAHQLDIARRKGGIGPREPIRIQRFQVDKVAEPSDPAPGRDDGA